MASTNSLEEVSEGIFSLLDTDLYKLTMQCVVYKKFKDLREFAASRAGKREVLIGKAVTYFFKNRTPHLRLNNPAFEWLKAQVDRLSRIKLRNDELDYLRQSYPSLDQGGYLSFLADFQFRPAEHITLTFVPSPDGTEGTGQVEIIISGLWVDTILYETPLLSLVSEAFFRFCDTDWNYDGQEEKAFQKGQRLLQNGCRFSDFGTRRRRDYHTQALVLQGLARASKEGSHSGAFLGTSNVHFAMKLGVPAVGTVAHEFFMGVAAASGDYARANENALEIWTDVYYRYGLGVVLSDTFGTDAFLQAFEKKVDPSFLRSDKEAGASTASFAEIFAGIRQDSGDPELLLKKLRSFYDKLGIGTKAITFSDSLNVDRCLKYRESAEKLNFTSSFGIGTHLTNDFIRSNGEKSPPLNIVIKISSANGRPAVKLSDDMGKHTGDENTVKHVKSALGYTEKHWENGNEASRWT